MCRTSCPTDASVYLYRLHLRDIMPTHVVASLHLRSKSTFVLPNERSRYDARDVMYVERLPLTLIQWAQRQPCSMTASVTIPITLNFTLILQMGHIEIGHGGVKFNTMYHLLSLVDEYSTMIFICSLFFSFSILNYPSLSWIFSFTFIMNFYLIFLL